MKNILVLFSLFSYCSINAIDTQTLIGLVYAAGYSAATSKYMPLALLGAYNAYSWYSARQDIQAIELKKNNIEHDFIKTADCSNKEEIVNFVKNYNNLSNQQTVQNFKIETVKNSLLTAVIIPAVSLSAKRDA